MKKQTISCFLCNPQVDLVYLTSSNFYAMLGLGPIVEGYSVVASRAHLPSMLDIPEEVVDEHQAFIREIRRLLGKLYRPSIISEHGRVPACDFYDRDGRDVHCYHAHQLVFPVNLDLVPVLRHQFGNHVTQFRDFRDARQGTKPGIEYLYFEGTDGSCVVVTPQARFARQFFRKLVANASGHPERAIWHSFPGWELIQAAQAKLSGEE